MAIRVNPILAFVIIVAMSACCLTLQAESSKSIPLDLSANALLHCMDADGAVQLPQPEAMEVRYVSIDEESGRNEFRRVRITIGPSTDRSGLMDTNDVLQGQYVHAAYVNVQPVAKWGPINPFVQDGIHVVYESVGVVGMNVLDDRPVDDEGDHRKQTIEPDNLPWPTFTDMSDVDSRYQDAAHIYPLTAPFDPRAAAVQTEWNDRRWAGNIDAAVFEYLRLTVRKCD